MKFLLLPLAVLSLTLLAFPLLAICKQLARFATGDFSSPQAYFVLACGTWLLIAVFEFWLYRLFGREQMTKANVFWFAIIALTFAVVSSLVALFVAESFHITFEEFGIGLILFVMGGGGTVVAATFFQLLRFLNSKSVATH